MLGHLNRRSSFQKAVHASPFLLLRSPLLDAIMEPRYLKSCTWLIVLLHTSNERCGQQLIVIYSVLGAKGYRGLQGVTKSYRGLKG